MVCGILVVIECVNIYNTEGIVRGMVYGIRELLENIREKSIILDAKITIFHNATKRKTAYPLCCKFQFHRKKSLKARRYLAVAQRR